MPFIDPKKYPSNSKFVQNQNNNPPPPPPNPQYRQQNIPRQKQVVPNNAMANRKKSLVDEFKDSIISKEHVDVGSYLVHDVIVPTIQNTVLDFLSIKFFGASQLGRNRAPVGRSLFDYGRQIFGYGTQYQYGTNYGSNYGYGRTTGYPNGTPQPDPQNYKVDYRNIILLNPDDAKAVVDSMRQRIFRFNEATVSDLYGAVGITASYTDDNWGWTNANDIGIKRVPEGWLIDVADAKYLPR